MARFTGKKAKETPGLNMGSMSDIIFMLLFFFMVITTMRESSLYVKIQVPQGTETSKLEKKSLVSYVNIGVPMDQFQSKYGKEPRIQLNDMIADVSDIAQWVEMERTDRSPADRPYITTAIKADMAVKMGLVSDIKQELRQAGAFRIFYNARKGERK
ncbi:MAG: biopolymer transporter ExbD [Bacteroidales bacterium]|jgi:biopolymer transport protein ExbD|nr:biopolymer transporter ExbD [Bacteroidales bacterium]